MTMSRTPSTPWKVMAALAIALSSAVAIGVGPRLEEKAARARASEQVAGPKRVRVATVRAGDATVDVTLPATSEPMRSSVLYSKSTGFVRANLVDIGDRVQEGQLLAEIDAPETGEEIRLAKARLAEAKANVGLVKTTAERLSSLAQAGAASQQEADDTREQANSADALVATRKAEVQRLRALQDYQRIVAPFTGIVTRRLVDPGALVGPASAGGVAMFEVAAIDTLRVVVDVPDSYASDIAVGIDADVYSPRDPARTVKGKVTRTSGVLDQTTRTLRVELNVPGGDVVLPGAFVYVKLHVPRERPVPVIPASALVVRKEGTLVARVRDGAVTMVPVKLGRDFGKEIEVVEGVMPGDEVVVQPSDTLDTGAPVTVIDAA
jgi:membrane fusion protein, multidrug efflux system